MSKQIAAVAETNGDCRTIVSAPGACALCLYTVETACFLPSGSYPTMTILPLQERGGPAC
jgi:hypothetical protein